MKKLFVLLLLVAATAFAAKPVVLEICRPSFCYQQMYEDVKKAEQKKDAAGNSFVRLTFFDGTVLDVDNATVVAKKRK